MYRTLNSNEVVETIDRLLQRIEDRFPSSGLGKVCRELSTVAKESADRSLWIERPNLWLRLGAAAVITLGITGIVASFLYMEAPLADLTAINLIQVMEAGLNDIILISAAIFFLITMETRIKRSRALDALHELRSISHVIDMHQLTKDPAHLSPRMIFTNSSPQKKLTSFELMRYPNYCSELLSLTGKVASIYSQHFRDSVVLATINDLETLTTGLSRKIWQKIIILEQLETKPKPQLSRNS
ncbi:MAG: hypothetical protein JXX29_08035 [Deltaproteobacteria bacterium]|nr:hypothetical protein [Deltaproteobacteria bacterium]MBN2671608.1 hypothetical protein [Deltaproteobacteria bacterium]